MVNGITYKKGGLNFTLVRPFFSVYFLYSTFTRIRAASMPNVSRLIHFFGFGERGGKNEFLRVWRESSSNYYRALKSSQLSA